MAQLKRSELIALGIEWAGRKGQSVDLVEHFDFITDDMSKRYPLLRGEGTGSVTADQNYITLPTLYRSQELFIYNGRETALKIGDNWLTHLNNPADFKEYDDTEYGTPNLYAVFDDPITQKIYFYPKTETLTPTYKFLYFAFHAKATDDNYLHGYGSEWDYVVVTGLAWRAGIALKEQDIADRWEPKYLKALRDMFSLTRPNRYRRVAYHDF